jgi:hypothetical protein
MTPEEDAAWREMVALGQELDAGLCWALWPALGRERHHRCMLTGCHEGQLHECCCGAKTEDAVRTVAHDHYWGTPCGQTCPVARKAGA